jgi:hypothetical protein
MKDLVQFLRARMDEDEKIALAVPVISGCVPPAHWGSSAVPGNETYVLGTAHDINAETVEGAAHIRRHDPARVLAEVDAKRRIICDHTAMRPGWCNTCDVPGDYRGNVHGCQTLRLLALSYRDHSDFRPEWTPDA